MYISHNSLKSNFKSHCPAAMGIFSYTQDRMVALYKGLPERNTAAYVSELMPNLFQEKEYNMKFINKIFASHWLSSQQVVFGTKCNKIMVMDLITKQITHIPSLRSSRESNPADCPCGIHSIDINPSKTLLATGGENTNDLAVYKLPTFDPICVGEHGHDDWIFDIKWLDDQFLVTGSRDSRLSLWRVREDEDNSASCIHHSNIMKSLKMPEYGFKKPVCVKVCKKAEKVRALAYNSKAKEVAALSLNAYIHLWDAETFTQKQSRKLKHLRENVCMAICEERNLYAVGSQATVTFLDPRSDKTEPVTNKQSGLYNGIRSLSFKEHIVTIGSGNGAIYFYDLRANKYLECKCGHACSLKVGKGYLLHDEMYRDFFMDQDYPNAIYTHCYDDSGTKLFSAGGPLPAGLWGNYASVWH